MANVPPATELESPPKLSTNPRRRLHAKKRGMIQVIFGPMFSGKTTELLRRIRRYNIRDDHCILLKTRDTRFQDDFDKVVSHDQTNWLHGLACDRLFDQVEAAKIADVIGIDEGQFFPDLAEFCETMAQLGKVVIVAALDSDYRREAFGTILSIVPKAESVTKLSSICYLCKEDAAFTARLTAETEVKVVGALDKYRPVCRTCYAESHCNK